jgi:hypothetical protein
VTPSLLVSLVTGASGSVTADHQAYAEGPSLKLSSLLAITATAAIRQPKIPLTRPKDPARAIQRRKVFYPYTANLYAIEITVSLAHADIEHLESDDVDLRFGPPALKEEIETWNDVYGIEERYKAKFCSVDAKDWLEQVRILEREFQVKPSVYLDCLDKHAGQAPYANCHFLKKPFLEACRKMGIFDTLAHYG